MQWVLSNQKVAKIEIHRTVIADTGLKSRDSLLLATCNQLRRSRIAVAKGKGPDKEAKEKPNDETKRIQSFFFPVRRLLGSCQVVTQCLCQLNELCSMLHRLLFGSLKREHRPLRSPNIVHVRWRPHEEKNTKQTKTTKPTPKPNPEKTTSSQWTEQLYANSAAYVLTIKPCMHRSNTETKKKQSKAPEKGAEKDHTTLRKPGVPPARIPEITTRRAQGITGTPIPGKKTYTTWRGHWTSSRHPAVVCKATQCAKQKGWDRTTVKRVKRVHPSQSPLTCALSIFSPDVPHNLVCCLVGFFPLHCVACVVGVLCAPSLRYSAAYDPYPLLGLR